MPVYVINYFHIKIYFKACICHTYRYETTSITETRVNTEMMVDRILLSIYGMHELVLEPILNFILLLLLFF